jgi:hypothetical protein
MKTMNLRRMLELGGLAAGVILIAFGAVAIFMGAQGFHTVRDNLKLEQIVGSSDMTPANIRKEIADRGLTGVSAPSCSVAGKLVDTGAEARCFAEYMRIHSLLATGGQVYAQMGRYIAKDGKATNDATKAAIDPKTNQPVENAARNLWVTETALTGSLNLAYTAENVALFGVVVGVALLLSGVGFVVLSLGGALRRFRVPSAEAAQGLTPAVPAA